MTFDEASRILALHPQDLPPAGDPETATNSSTSRPDRTVTMRLNGRKRTSFLRLNG
jgi:hypothetical protein